MIDKVVTGEDVDLSRFPPPRHHAKDGGRYMGTGDCVINQDPEHTNSLAVFYAVPPSTSGTSSRKSAAARASCVRG